MNGPAGGDDGVGVVAANDGVDAVVAPGESVDDAGDDVLPDAQPARTTTDRAVTITNLTLRASRCITDSALAS